MKKKVLPAIFIIVLIFIIGGIYAGQIAYQHYSYSSERADLNDYFDITDSEGNKCEEAVSITDDSIIYRVGETVRPNAEFDNHMLIDGSGIHFYLTKTEAEDLEIGSVDDEEEEDCEDEE